MKTDIERELEKIQSSASKSKHLSLLTILGLIFVVLKLANVGVVATWSWWLVLLPFLIQIGLAALAVVLAVALILINAFSNKW